MVRSPKWAALVVATAFAIGAALSVSGASAAQPANESGASAVLAGPAAPATNGDYCGTEVIDVPDSGPYFNFSDACETHDECYAYGGSEADRTQCDATFLGDMLESCQAMWPVTNLSSLYSRNRCYRVAYVYYLGVRLGGSSYFNYS